jgi:hypothetical protein
MSWSWSVVFVAVFAVVTPLAGQQSPGAATASRKPAAVNDAGSTKYFRLHWAQLVDQYGFARPMEVARLLVPVDWKFEGVVAWGAAKGCPPDMVKSAGSATSTDGLSAFSFLPSHTWQWWDDPRAQQRAASTGGQSSTQTGCAAAPLMGAVDYLRQSIIPQFRQGARVVATEPMPKLAQSLTSEAQTAAAGAIQARMETGVRVDAGRVKIAYEINGHPVEEWIMATVQVVAKPMGMGGQNGNWYNVSASRIFAYRTPAGKLDSEPALFGTILGSITNNPNWTAAATRIQMGTAKAEQKGTADRIRIRSDLANTQNNAINARYQQISESEDKQSEEFAQTQRGLQWYTDPNTHEKVEMSYGYRHSYTNGNGEYILNDDPNFNPGKYFNGTWTQLEQQ